MEIDQQLLQNTSLIVVRIIIAIAVFTHDRRHIGDISSYAKFNGVSPKLAQFSMVIRIILATAILAGTRSKLAAAGLTIIFISSVGLHILKWKSPFAADEGGWEHSLLLAGLCVTIYSFGSGDWSL